jgi:hypothetical protein
VAARPNEYQREGVRPKGKIKLLSGRIDASRNPFGSKVPKHGKQGNNELPEGAATRPNKSKQSHLVHMGTIIASKRLI